MGKTKCVCRGFPQEFTEQDFLETFFSRSKPPFFYFVPSSERFNNIIPPVAYIGFQTTADLLKFYQEFQGRVISSKTTNKKQSIFIEYAPNQVISDPSKGYDDPKMNTIENDEDYQNFLLDLRKPIEKERSAEAVLEEQEELEKKLQETSGNSFGGSSTKLKSTPLVEELLSRKSKEKQQQQRRQQQPNKKGHSQSKNKVHPKSIVVTVSGDGTKAQKDGKNFKLKTK